MRTRQAGIPVDLISTEDLLRLHERVFGPLDPVDKDRILTVARTNGWDRDWESDALAA